MPERRVDPSDGNKYTRQEFDACYGKDCVQWELALKLMQRAARGADQRLVCCQCFRRKPRSEFGQKQLKRVRNASRLWDAGQHRQAMESRLVFCRGCARARTRGGTGGRALSLATTYDTHRCRVPIKLLVGRILPFLPIVGAASFARSSRRSYVECCRLVAAALLSAVEAKRRAVCLQYTFPSLGRESGAPLSAAGSAKFTRWFSSTQTQMIRAALGCGAVRPQVVLMSVPNGRRTIRCAHGCNVAVPRASRREQQHPMVRCHLCSGLICAACAGLVETAGGLLRPCLVRW